MASMEYRRFTAMYSITNKSLENFIVNEAQQLKLSTTSRHANSVVKQNAKLKLTDFAKFHEYQWCGTSGYGVLRLRSQN